MIYYFQGAKFQNSNREKTLRETITADNPESHAQRLFWVASVQSLYN